jgi:hypothetical protein
MVFPRNLYCTAVPEFEKSKHPRISGRVSTSTRKNLIKSDTFSFFDFNHAFRSDFFPKKTPLSQSPKNTTARGSEALEAAASVSLPLTCASCNLPLGDDDGDDGSMDPRGTKQGKGESLMYA